MTSSFRNRLPPAVRLTAGVLAALCLTAWPASAMSDPTPTATDATASGAPKDRIEVAVVPIVGGDTDVGIGGGVISSIARPAPGAQIFRWKLEGVAFVTGKSVDDQFRSPYQDFYLMLTNKNLLAGRMRLELRAAYTREANQRYFGLGNASTAPVDEVPSRDHFTRTHPTARARARFRVAGPLHVQVGAMYMYNAIDIEPDSTLLRDATSGSDRVRRLLPLNTSQGVQYFEAGLVYDSRDDEISPARGQHHRLEMRASPWETRHLPNRYMGVSASFTGFVPIVSDRAVLAGRVVGDVQMGNVPAFELSRFDESSALGGPRYVRGVPANRYWGKRKFLSNLELRVRLWRFHVRKSDYELGTTAFFDSGRVWADLTRAEELDGRGLGLKFGTGGGLRLQKGKTFVLRADVAWSPDARPIGGYFLAEHIF